jgi:hypothetical protein
VSTKLTRNGIEAAFDSSSADTIIIEAAALAISADQTCTTEITLDTGQAIESAAAVLEDGSFFSKARVHLQGGGRDHQRVQLFLVQGQATAQVTITGTTLLGQGASSASVTLTGVVAAVDAKTNDAGVVDAGVSAATAAGAVVITADYWRRCVGCIHFRVRRCWQLTSRACRRPRVSSACYGSARRDREAISDPCSAWDELSYCKREQYRTDI